VDESNALDLPIARAAERGDRAALNSLLTREAALDSPILKAARALSLRVCANPPR
jgi:hypothetical protein